MRNSLGYWIDENGNRWDCNVFTEKQSEEHSKSLANCCYMFDSYDCINCQSCVKCVKCKNCVICFNLYECTNCTNCSNNEFLCSRKNVSKKFNYVKALWYGIKKHIVLKK